MKILITGGTGFIGQHLLEELKDDAFSLRIISRQAKPAFWCTNKNFEVVQGDIADKGSLEKAFAGVDILVNLAAELRDPGKFEASNITGVKNIIELSEKNNIKKIVHLSSVGVVGMQYSRKKIVVDENTACHPKNEYERTKLQSEILLNEFGKKSKTAINILRPTNVFGDHHPRQALLGFLQRVKSGGSFPAAPDAVVNYVYAKDVAHALRFCLLNSIGNKTFNVGENMSFQDFLDLAAKELNVRGNTTRLPSLVFALLEVFGYFGIKKLRAQFRGLSNCVEYRDSYMQQSVKYKYGIPSGLAHSVAFFKLK